MTVVQTHIDLGDFREQAERLTEERRRQVNAYEDALTQLAQRRQEYEMTKAIWIVEAKASGVGITEAQERVRGEVPVRDAMLLRDVAEGAVKAAQERLETIDGERALLRSLAEWSMKYE